MKASIVLHMYVSLSVIQEEQLSVKGERLGTEYWLTA